MSKTEILFPRDLLETPQESLIHAYLEQHKPESPEWKYQIPFHRPLKIALENAILKRHIIIGLESAEEIMRNEHRGMDMAKEKVQDSYGKRLSRIIVLANDGADRFYRAAQKLLLANIPRMLCFQLNLKGIELAQHLNLPGRDIKCLLINHKNSVSAILKSLCEEPPAED